MSEFLPIIRRDVVDLSYEAELTPERIVAELDKYIIGQERAKRAVAIALRNRYRRLLLPESLREEIAPKNILMIGPTGVGKTEIARRISKLVSAPFIKVEATKYTEVGYVGRDVESIIRDLTEIAVRMVESEKMKAVEDKATRLANLRLLEALKLVPQVRRGSSNEEGFVRRTVKADAEHLQSEFDERIRRLQEYYLRKIEAGEFEDEEVEIEVEEKRLPIFIDIIGGQGAEQFGFDPKDMIESLLGKRKKLRIMKVREARRVLIQEEARKLIDQDEVTQEALERVQQRGIVFIDEIDKIAGRERGFGPDVSREGVQRDLLPIIEGTTVMTRYGAVNTHHILFICAGAFHVSKPSDLIPELQGRLPIRVELDPLTEEDFRRILVEPENALVKQYQALLATEGVRLEFTEDGIREIARFAKFVNDETEDIGARRLYTVMERVLEDISFEAPQRSGERIVVDSEYVRKRLEGIVQKRDLARYIL
ncbi:MAG: ATP-dependent protease ATPase subunit HslU [Armatimonadota bacterium]|nr:ATP-dependent protease ATPase subunit HslU [Armatimonadota bacterium]MCX7776720.1 ATP-dependent protease ATPase subunit HslU [Armatimonadota bacterium]MDW8025789.1 ATP-dependent protease ATPase subunit HslU [Armatimonadota bacterium]